jgi:hypothetical protein
MPAEVHGGAGAGAQGPTAAPYPYPFPPPPCRAPQGFDLVFATQQPLATVQRMDQLCAAADVKYMAASVLGAHPDSGAAPGPCGDGLRRSDCAPGLPGWQLHRPGPRAGSVLHGRPSSALCAAAGAHSYFFLNLHSHSYMPKVGGASADACGA